LPFTRSRLTKVRSFGRRWFSSRLQEKCANSLGAAIGRLFLILAFAAAGWGQDAHELDSGSIAGSVTVSGGQSQAAGVPGVTVTLTALERDTGSINAVTDDQGSYRFAGLSPGTYSLAVEQDGFEPRREVVSVEGKQSIAHEIVLRLSRVTQQVDVQGKNSDILTQTSEPAARVSERQMESLPLAEQKFTAALPLVPGVVRTPDGKLNFKGQSENQGLLLVDSTENVDPVTGSFAIPIPIDSIESMSVSSAPDSAVYGGFSGGLTRIETKPPFSEWKYKLHDFVPGVRGKSGHLAGIAEFTPRLQFGGPIIPNVLNFTEEAEYEMRNQPVRGLPWPYNETKIHGFTSFTQFQAILSPHHILTANVDVFPMQKRFADINALVPQSASSDYHQHGASLSISDANQLSSGALLTTVLRYTRFDSDAHGQGPADMLVTPEGWRGNFFDAWQRTSNAFEAMPTLQLPQKTWLGHHDIRFGMDVSHRSYDGGDLPHEIELLRDDQSPAERIDFAGNGRVSASDTEVAEFMEDQWSLNSHVALKLGARFSSQSIGREGAFGPHLGLSYAPGKSGKTVLRASSAVFYGHVPLLAADFNHNPTRITTFLDSSGTMTGTPIPLPNLCFSSHLGFTPQACDDGTSPRTFTWSAELEHEFSRAFVFRLNYLDSQTRNLSRVGPALGVLDGTSALGLSDDGTSRYHRVEVAARFHPSERSDLNLAYVWSRSRGDLNTLSDVFVPFEAPVIRPNVSGVVSSDVPHRLVSWGSFRIPGQFTLGPVIDVRTGLPYSAVDVLQNYVGLPNSRRFPTFLSFDLKVYREFPLRMPFAGHSDKRKIRLGVYALNLTNHYNPDQIYNSVASPQFGQFAGNHHRIAGLVIDIVN